jgi:hypothetical protein
VTGARVLAYFSQNPCIQQENSSNISFICIGLRFFQEALIAGSKQAGGIGDRSEAFSTYGTQDRKPKSLKQIQAAEKMVPPIFRSI